MAKIPLRVLSQGLFCPPGNFFIDARRPVPTCIVTHAHSDHAYPGHGLYIGTKETLLLVRHRLGDTLPCQEVAYGQKFQLGSCSVSLHPAGHILGSAQIRIENKNCVTVISGDFKRAHDNTCVPFEVLECDFFVTESTFALPIYQWPHSDEIAAQIKQWWAQNSSKGYPSVIFCYPMGKAQRILSFLVNEHRPVYLHGAPFSISNLYLDLKIPLISFEKVHEKLSYNEALILAPPSAAGSAWMRHFPHCRTAFASGWMQVRGMRHRQVVDRGFILSDHADWDGLLKTIQETKAKIVLTTHGNSATLAKYLREEKKLHSHELAGLVEIAIDED